MVILSMYNFQERNSNLAYFVTVIFMPVGEFEVYRRHRLILENWAKTRPHYQDLVAMILLEVSQRRLIFLPSILTSFPGREIANLSFCLFVASKHDSRNL